MFDYPTSAIREITAMRRHLIDNQLAELRRLGHARDIELLFEKDNYLQPDWGFADCLGEDVHAIVKEIFINAHNVARAEDELELRARPN
jgi:hypothetical protein